MVNSWLIICSLTMYLLIFNVQSYLVNNDLKLRDLETDNVELLEAIPIQSSHEDYEIDRVKKILNIVINPVADDIVDVRVNAPSNLDTGSSEPVIVGDRTPLTPSRRNYLTNLIYDGIKAISWRVVKFFICNVFSSRVACTVMNVLSDEEEGALSTPEGIARGLRFIEDVIEMYHSAQKRLT